jgi:hypothetical protein
MAMQKSNSSLAADPGYVRFVAELKARVEAARISAARRINAELVLLYWDIGRGIVDKQKALGWGESVVEEVSADLRREFPGMTGFSARNIWDMKRLYLACSEPQFLQQVVAELKRSPPLTRFLPQTVAEIRDPEILEQTVQGSPPQKIN